MSQPNEPWEEHWRDTLAEHETSPPSAHDWGGMEQLLDAPVVPDSPIAAPAPKPALPAFNLPALPWPVWVLALAFVLALGYWLGNRTADAVSLEMENERKQAQQATAVPAQVDTVYLLGPKNKFTDNALPIDTLINYKNTSSSLRLSPEINTPNPAGGGSISPPPATSSVADDSYSVSTAPATSSSGESGLKFEKEGTAPARSAGSITTLRRPNAASSNPALSYGLSSESAVRPNRGGYVRPLKTLSPPTDQELLEQRIDALSLSEKLVITPTRYKNGYFPAYRPRN